MAWEYATDGVFPKRNEATVFFDGMIVAVGILDRGTVIELSRRNNGQDGIERERMGRIR